MTYLCILYKCTKWQVSITKLQTNVKIQFAMSNDLLYDDANLRNVCDKNNNAEHNSDTIARKQMKYYFPMCLSRTKMLLESINSVDKIVFNRKKISKRKRILPFQKKSANHILLNQKRLNRGKVIHRRAKSSLFTWPVTSRSVIS